MADGEETQDVIDVDPDAATDEVEEVELDVDADAESEADVDPVQARLEEMANELNAVKELTGKIDTRRFQGVLDRSQATIEKQAQQIEELQARVEANSTPSTTPVDPNLQSIVEALIADPIVDDATKRSLSTVRDGILSARQQADVERVVEERLAQQNGSSKPESQESLSPDQQVQLVEMRSATAEVTGYARAKGVDPQSIPREQWDLQDGETLQAASTRVMGWIDAQQEEEAAADTAARARKAAGNGSPASAGATSSLDTILKRLEDDGLPMSETAARKKAAAALGIELSEG